jgi:D-alanyl-D-alanine carboxypeptidase
MIIERVSGEQYGEFLARRLFRPLGMTSTFVPDAWQIIPRRANGYTLRNGVLVRIRRDGQVELGSHMSLFSSLADLVKFDAALDAGRVLPRAALEQMWTPALLNEAAGGPTASAGGSAIGAATA